MDITRGIPAVIIQYLSISYTDSGLEYPLYIYTGILLQCLAVGLIAVDEFEGARFVILGRVSTPEQYQNADFQDRLQPLRDVFIGELDGRVVKEYTGKESGATMERENLEEILELAEEDEFDVLAVKNLDRLSRANPWETIEYLLKLQEEGITLYEHPRRFFEWEDLNDFQQLAQGMIFSHQWLRRLEEGRREGVFSELKKGRWPMNTHFGYEKDDNADDDERNLYLQDSKEPILYEIFDIYEETGNISKTQDEINDRFEDELDGELSRSRIETVLRSKLCVGKLEYEGVVKNKIPDLAVVSEEKFERVQAILDSTSRDQPGKVPEAIVDTTTKFGIEYVQGILEQISFRRCKKCGGKLEPYSTREVFGIPVEKVRCQSCDYDGGLVSEKELLEIHQTAPIRCPFCFRSEEFTVEESKHGLDMYQYECNNCEHQFHTDTGPDKVRRYLDHPELGVTLDENGLQRSTGSNQSSDSGSDPDSHDQMKLSDL